MTNIEAFQELDAAIIDRGRPFLQKDIVAQPNQPDAVVAHGLERDDIVDITEPVFIGGRLAVRALLADQAVDNPFQISDPLQQAARWLVRTRLTFSVPMNRHHLEVGDHAVIAAYTLLPEAPQQINNYYAKPEPERDEKDLDKLATTQYIHVLPGYPGAFINPDHPASPRTKLLRKWFNQPPHSLGMATLSPTSDGQISQTELPLTISWLLQNPH